MKEALISLYQSNWEPLQVHLSRLSASDEFRDKPTSPLLISLEDYDEYESADIRLMVFGQETNNWFGEFNPNMMEVLGLYESYFLSGDWMLDKKRVFWRGLKPYLDGIREKFPEKNFSFIWNNLSKVGKISKGSSPKYIRDVELEYFSVIKAEIEILRPNIILFFTGFKRDEDIKSIFSTARFESISGFPIDELASISSIAGSNVFRTYHPYAVNSFGKSYVSKLQKTIIEQISL